MKTVLHVVGARPNFMKVAPVMQALRGRSSIEQLLVHTGQHYDPAMTSVFFGQLGIGTPDINLGVGSGSHAGQTARIMIRFEEIVTARRPDLVLVYGDVNSTVAAALVCAKLSVPFAHVEAGLRSYDRSMPEEINRVVTDQLADLLFTPSEDGDANLLREGIAPSRIHRVGNVMIDTLMRLIPAARPQWPKLQAELRLERFCLVTLHRPSNVDDPEKLPRILDALGSLEHGVPVVFPVHPRTRDILRRTGASVPPAIRLTEPLGYLDFLALEERATLVVTDSGGVQEETTFLGVPCLTLRPNTERPVTVSIGTNTLIGDDLGLLQREVAKIVEGKPKRGAIPPMWDGAAGERTASAVDNMLSA